MNAVRRALLPMVVALATGAIVRSQESPATPSPLSFDGLDVAAWQRLAIRQPSLTAAQLSRGGTACLPMVRELLASNDEGVVAVAAQAAGQVGPPAAPLVPDLVKRVRTFGNWQTPMFCTIALGKIGVPDRDGVDAMFEHVGHSDVPLLRHECTMTLAKLEPDLVARVTAAADRGAFRDRAFAIEAMVWLGDSAVPPLVAALPAKDDDPSVARDALMQLGWRAVSALERAGKTKLVADALRLGAMQRCVCADAFVATWKDPDVAIPRLPDLVWERSYGHGSGCELFRAVEGPRGLEVTRVTLVESRDERPHVQTHTTTLPRERAFAVGKQLLALPRFVLTRRAGHERSTMTSSNDFHVAVLAKIGDESVLDAEFGGYPGSDNVPDRFVAEVAIAVLAEALDGATWTQRVPNDADDAFVAARAAAITTAEPEWSASRKKLLAKLLSR